MHIKNEKKIIIVLLIIIQVNIYFKKDKLKIGVISLSHSQNIGNNLLKYAIFIKLSELGFDPYISFLQNKVKLRILQKTFREIKKEDYDLLMVNSDQTWEKYDNFIFYDIAFLRFAKNWKIKKFIYGASGSKKWLFNKIDKKIAKNLLKNFTGLSFREKESAGFVQKQLGFKTYFVLDPTFLIDKKYYLDLIENFQINHISNDTIFAYTVTNKIRKLVENLTTQAKLSLYFIDTETGDNIRKFLYGVYKCKAVITDSYHGTLFSIIFNKPFISFAFEEKFKERFDSLKEIFDISERIYTPNEIPNIQLLSKPLTLKLTKFNLLKKNSINFLKHNLIV